jgi:hypothetical protein
LKTIDAEPSLHLEPRWAQLMSTGINAAPDVL